MENYWFYKIICILLGVNEIYVGHTKDVKNRDDTHKGASKSSDYKVYRYIREHGGWENFKMVILEERECENRAEAETIEGNWRKKKWMLR